MQDAQERLAAARKEDPTAGLDDVAHSPGELQQWVDDFREENRPPVGAPDGFAVAKQELLDLSLLAPVRFADDEEDRFLVHRWTASALGQRSRGAEQRDAHYAAAAYWRWRVEKLPQSRQNDIADLLEARHHLHEAGDLPRFHILNATIITQLETWAAWEWEERLIQESLSSTPEGSQDATMYLHQLGIVAQHRGDYDAALDWYRSSLAISEQLSETLGVADSLHQLGTLALQRSDYNGSLDWSQKSLAMYERLGNRAGMADCYHQLGMVAQMGGDCNGALDWYRKSLTIREELGDRGRTAHLYHQMGTVAQTRGDYDAALDWYHQSLAIKEQRGDRAGIASSYHQLGVVARFRRDYDAALRWCRKSLAIQEQLRNRYGMAGSYHLLGMVAQDRDDYDAALDWYRKSLAINEQLGDRAAAASTTSQIGVLYTQTGRAADAVPFNLRSFSLRLEIESPEVRVDLDWLSRQRSIMGAEVFRALLTQHVDTESAAGILAFLNESEPGGKEIVSPSTPRRGAVNSLHNLWATFRKAVHL